MHTFRARMEMFIYNNVVTMVLQVVVPVGEPVTVDCVVSGTPRPVVLWMQERDRTVLLPGDRIAETGLGVTEQGSLKISNAQISSSYVCLASNLVGSAMARTDVIVVASKADAEQVIFKIWLNHPRNDSMNSKLSETTNPKVLVTRVSDEVDAPSRLS